MNIRIILVQNIHIIRLWVCFIFKYFYHEEIQLHFSFTLQTEAAMLNDAVNVFAKALIQNGTYRFRMNPIECYSYAADQETDSNGGTILENLNNVIDLCLEHIKQFHLH